MKDPVERMWEAAFREATDYLQQFLQIDTTNPPGNEAAAIKFLAQTLEREGIKPTIIEAAPGRSNLVCRLSAALPTKGGALLLTSHVDVAPAETDKWTHPPFGGDIADGYIWGRGALDMKSKTIMDLMALLLLKRNGVSPHRDVIFAALADEEVGMIHGSKFLVENHPDLLRAEYALNEVGGFTVHVNGHRIYPVAIAEKGLVWCKVVARGKSGHSARPHGEMAMAKLGCAIHRLTTQHLPMHPTPAAVGFVSALAEASPGVYSIILRTITAPVVGPLIESCLPDNDSTAFILASLHNTACPTASLAGLWESHAQIPSINVIPSEATLYIDGRIVPGQTTESFLAELRALLGEGYEITVIRERTPTVGRSDTPLFGTIKEVIIEQDVGSKVTPYMLTGMTDAQFFKQLGITTYGFQPLKCPLGYIPAAMYHAHDERIPLEGFHWGVRTYYEVVRRFAG